MEDNAEQIIAILATVVAAIIGIAWWGLKGWANSENKPKDMSGNTQSEIDSLRAVVDRIEADVAKLVAAELEFQSKGWTSLPPDLASSSGLTAAIYELRRDVAEMKDKLLAHDEWERREKYDR